MIMSEVADVVDGRPLPAPTSHSGSPLGKLRLIDCLITSGCGMRVDFLLSFITPKALIPTLTLQTWHRGHSSRLPLSQRILRSCIILSSPNPRIFEDMSLPVSPCEVFPGIFESSGVNIAGLIHRMISRILHLRHQQARARERERKPVVLVRVV